MSKKSTTKSLAKILSSKIVFRGPVFGVRRDRVIEPGGVHATRDVVTHGGSVVVMPVFSNGDILLIRQYRHSIGDYLWELVAGRKEPNESTLAGAKRELREETGYTAHRFRKLLTMFPTPGYLNEYMVVFAAEGLESGQAAPEEDERITARRFSPKEIKRWLRAGKIHDSKSIAGMLYYLDVYRKTK
jgi:ADP-ribose pyrophosphatase